MFKKNRWKKANEIMSIKYDSSMLGLLNTVQ